jgi:uncharacterized protein YutE (UPF0331/DUF86 family)
MDRALIEEKLESLRRCVRRIQDKRPDSAQALAGDLDAQDILALNLTRAIQLCVDVGAHLIAGENVPPPQTMGSTFDLLADLGYIDSELATRMKKAVGFRNIAVHNYEAIDWEIVHALVTHNLDDFQQFALAVVRKAGV